MKHKNIFIEQWIKNVIEIITFPSEQGGSHDKRQNEKNMLRLKEALLTINEVEIGKTLLELIRVNVLRRGKLKLVTYPSKNMSTRIDNGCNHANLSNGVGISPILFCDFSFLDTLKPHTTPFNPLNRFLDRNKPQTTFFNQLNQKQSDACSIFHELVHVYHALIGEHTTVQFPPNNPLQTSNLYEEARTVGLGSFKNEPISENKYREEAHLPRRAMYETPNGYILDNDTFSLKYGKWKGSSIIPFPH